MSWNLTPASKADTFKRAYPGRVTLPTDAQYLAERGGWNLAADQRPAAIITPTGAADVREAVAAARSAHLRIAPQGTGHNAGALVPLDDSVLLRTSAMQELRVDPDARTARIGAGVVWEQVVEAAAAHGLTALHGSSPNVGVIGYLLGGGLSWYSRTYGLATNHVLAFEVVLADGSVVTADRDQNRELFWALRGGGGGFGIVTAVEIALMPIPTAYAGAMIWPQHRAPEVLRAWRDLTADLPDEVSTTLRLMNFPPLPELPEFLRGRRVVVVDGVTIGDETTARPLLAPLRALRPDLDSFDRVPSTAVPRVHMDPEDPVPVVSGSTILSDLPDEALDELLAQAGPDVPPRLVTVELRHLGGAIARRPSDGGVTSGFDGLFLLFAGTMAMTPQMAADGHAAAAEVVEAMTKFGTERPYLNFIEHPTDHREAFDPSAWRQLVGIKSALDPDDLFVGAHGVPTLYRDGQATT